MQCRNQLKPDLGPRRQGRRKGIERRDLHTHLIERHLGAAREEVMSHCPKTHQHDRQVSESATNQVARTERAPAESKSEREALDWLVGQLKFERTLEVLRAQGPEPEPREAYLAA
jgi:hypothetical protein